MSMTSNLTKAIDRAFLSLGDIVGPVIVRQHVEAYNPSTGVLDKTTTLVTAEGIVAEYKSDDAEGSVVQTEFRRIFLKHVDGLNPKVGDEMVDESGNIYQVLEPNQIRPRSTTLLWDVKCRA